jgi:hypothetical protein
MCLRAVRTSSPISGGRVSASAKLPVRVLLPYLVVYCLPLGRRLVVPLSVCFEAPTALLLTGFRLGNATCLGNSNARSLGRASACGGAHRRGNDAGLLHGRASGTTTSSGSVPSVSALFLIVAPA